jgi:hypothetical protein
MLIQAESLRNLVVIKIKMMGKVRRMKMLHWSYAFVRALQGCSYSPLCVRLSIAISDLKSKLFILFLLGLYIIYCLGYYIHH